MEDIAGYCEYCGEPMTASDVQDFCTLRERCYYQEYYGHCDFG